MGFPLLKHRSYALSRSTRCATHSEDRVNTVAPILSSRVDLGDARLQPSLSFWTMYCSAHVMPVSCPEQRPATLVAQIGDRPAPVPSRGPGRSTTREASYRRPRLRGPLRCVARVARQRPDVTPWRIAVRGDVSASARSSCCPDPTGCPAGLASHPNSHRLRRSTTAPRISAVSDFWLHDPGLPCPGRHRDRLLCRTAVCMLPCMPPDSNPRRFNGILTDLCTLRRACRSGQSARRPASDCSGPSPRQPRAARSCPCQAIPPCSTLTRAALRSVRPDLLRLAYHPPE